jgi:general L-amino acid transport system permease protein
MAIVTATALGTALGIMRLSSNWLVRNVALCVGEVVKNTPQLVQIFFIYVAVLQALPQLRQSYQLGGSALLNVRGLFLPAPILSESAAIIGWASLAALIGFIALRWAAARSDDFGRRRLLGWLSWAPFLLVILAGWLGGAIAGWDEPKLDRFNIRGGFSLKPELLALWIGLSTYASAFIADIVRAAILGIHKGQTEAAMSLGLTRGQTLRLVILPQARRLIIPPLTSQFLNITKSSSLGASIAYPELVLMIGRTMLNQTGQAIESMTIVLGVFLTINLIIAFLMNWYNRAVALKER